MDEYGFRRVTEQVYAGETAGYHTVITFNEQAKRFYIRMSAIKAGDDPGLYAFLDSLREYKIIMDTRKEPYAVMILGRYGFNSTNTINTIGDCLDQTAEYLIHHGYESGCMVSGEMDDSIRLSLINNEYVYASDHGYTEIQQHLDDEKIALSQRYERIGLGLVGAFFGAALGGILWILIGHIGFYAWIAGIMAIFAAFKGYTMLSGGKISKWVVPIVYVIVLAVLVASGFIEWGWYLFDFYKEMYDITFIGALRDTPEFIFSNASLRQSFLMDLAIGCGVVMLAGIPSVIGLYNQSVGNYTMRRDV